MVIIVKNYEIVTIHTSENLFWGFLSYGNNFFSNPGWSLHWNFDCERASGFPGQGPDGSGHSVQAKDGTCGDCYDGGSELVAYGIIIMFQPKLLIIP